MGLFSRWRKSNHVLRLAKVLGTASDSVEALLDSSKDQALHVLLDLCESDPDCTAVMVDHRLDREMVAEIYHRLLAIGAGQWVGYHYVPVSVVAHATLLSQAAEGFAAAESRSDSERVAADLLETVQNGRFA